jgi:hypothetical protein
MKTRIQSFLTFRKKVQTRRRNYAQHLEGHEELQERLVAEFGGQLHPSAEARNSIGQFAKEFLVRDEHLLTALRDTNREVALAVVTLESLVPASEDVADGSRARTLSDTIVTNEVFDEAAESKRRKTMRQAQLLEDRN